MYATFEARGVKGDMKRKITNCKNGVITQKQSWKTSSNELI